MGHDGIVSGPDTREPAASAAPPTRSRDSRVLAGVCGGLARRTDIDPVVYRVTFAVLGCLGVGLLLYGAAWLLLPRDGDDGAEAERLLRRRIDGPAILAVLVAVLLVGGLFPSDFGSPTIALVVVLGVAALAAQRRGVDLAGALRSVPGRLRFPPRTEGRTEGAAAASHEPTGHDTGPPGRAAPEETRANAESPHPGGGASRMAPDDRPATADPVPGSAQPPPPWQPPPHPSTPTSPLVRPPDESRTGSDDRAEHPAYGPGAPYPPDAPTHWLYGPAATEAPRTAEMPGSAGMPGSVPGSDVPPYSPYAYGYSPTETFPAAPEQRTRGGLLTLLTISAALVVAGALTALTLAGVAPLGPELVLAAVIVTIGAGLLVGTLYGRGRPLVAIGLPLSVILIAITALGHPQGASVLDGFGERSWQPTGEVERPYHLGAGEGHLDLTDLPPGDAYEITADVGAGELRVRVPRTAEVTVHAQVYLGTIRLDDSQIASGHDLSVTRTLSPSQPSSGPDADRTSIELHLGTRMGEVVVDRVSP